MIDSDRGIEANADHNPYLKEQDKGIIEAFSREEHRVLTNTEISDNVSLSRRQVRRRLDDLAERGVIGKRTVSGVKLAWLEKNVKEPITVQYPLLRFVRDHASVQLFLTGIAGGIIAVLLSLGAAISLGYGVQLPYLSTELLVMYGILAGATSALFILVAILMALFELALRHFGPEIRREKPD